LLNTVIDTSTELGANNVGGVSFTLSEEKQKELKTQARKEAIENAKKNAEELSGLSGMRLGKIVNVSENQPSPNMRLFNTAAMDEAVSLSKEQTVVEPGSQDYTYAVILSYETL
jgi:hypothetical protein